MKKLNVQEFSDLCDADLERRELAERRRHRHELGKPCPLTGEQIPSHVWTDHDRPGVFNACGACHGDEMSIGERLAQLEEQRRRDAERTPPRENGEQ